MDRRTDRPGALRRTILLAALANGVLFFHGCKENHARVSLGFPVPFAAFETRGARLFVHLEGAVPDRLQSFSGGLLALNALALAALIWWLFRKGGPGGPLLCSAVVALIGFNTFPLDVGVWYWVAIWPTLAVGSWIGEFKDPAAGTWFIAISSRAWYAVFLLVLSWACRGVARFVKRRRGSGDSGRGSQDAGRDS